MTYPSVVKYLLLGKESVWGTATTTICSRESGLIISDISNPINREVKETKGMSNIETQQITSGIVDPGVSVSGDFQHGRLLEYIYGTVAHSDASTPDMLHTFTISDTPPSATLEVGNNLTTDTVATNSGMLIESAELSIALNENLKLSVDFKGKQTAMSASATAVITSTLAVFPHALCSVKLNGTAATEVQNASITIPKVVERSGGISSNLYQQGHATEMSFGFAATLGFTDKTYHELFLGGASATILDPTKFDFEIIGDNKITAASGKRYIGVVLNNCIGDTFNEVSSVGGLTFLEISGKGTAGTCTTYDNIGSTVW